MHSLRRLARSFSGCVCAVLILRTAAFAGTITVLNTNDTGAGSLRAAVAAAAPGDTINFAGAATGTISCTSGPVELNRTVSIRGPGAASLVMAGGFSNVFLVTSGTALVADLTISGGFSTNGGGIRQTAGSLTVSNCVLGTNTAPPGQGGKGGAINLSGGSLAIINSTLNANRANLGGAIYNNGGQLAVTNSTFTANETTIFGGSGSAIYNETGSTAILQSCTITSNIITSGTGFGAGIRNNGTAHVGSTIIFGNTGPTGPDVYGAFISDGYNLIGNTNSATGFTNGVNHDLTALDPLVGALQNNGGPTPTMALLGASPAIDKGQSRGLTTDQRGQPRSFDNLLVANASGGDGADIGAFESSLIVQNNNDSGPGSLRQAVADNASLGGGNTIGFAANVTGVIVLTSGELLLGKNIGLAGPGSNLLSVSGNNSSRAFHVTNGITATITGLGLTQGRGAMGGAILQDSGNLTVAGCNLSSNLSTLQGGAIGTSSGTLSLLQCTLAYNRGTNDGGAVFQATGSLSIASCTLAHNFSSIRGGAATVNPDASAIITSSTFASNSATFGGALMLYPAVKITNCTFTGNSAVFGGGIDNFATATTTIRNTIMAGNFASANGLDAYGAFSSAGYNLVGSTNDSTGWTGSGDQKGSIGSPLNALLGPLRLNGGPIATMALQAGSPAIDKGSSSGASTDQRGAPRPFDFAAIANATGGDGSDIGAFELATPTLGVERAAAGALVVYWPAVYGDFVLEGTDTLVPPTWSAVGANPIVAGANLTVTNLPASDHQFFRLRSF
jgi:hypothetical protein